MKRSTAGVGLLMSLIFGTACGGGEAPPVGSGGQVVATGGAGAVTGAGGAVTGSGGGLNGSGGGAASGGAIGTGGSVIGSGGGTSTGGLGGGSQGGLTDISGKAMVACNLTVLPTTSVSEIISTVTIVEFSAEFPGATAGFIQFGKTADYTLEAPVDLSAPNYRTLLLGMPTSTEVHYRIGLVTPTEACVTPDQTITTGPLPAGSLGNSTVTPGPSNAPIEPGFIVNSTFNDTWVYILNDAGELVWYFEAPFPNSTRARISWDGKYMWLRDGNPGGSAGQGSIAKITMDGSSSESVSVPTSHHDLSVLPDGSIVYIKKNPAGTCDAIYRHAGDGMNFESDTMVFDIATAFSGGTCHTNSIHYHVADGSYTISDLDHDAYVKVSAEGELEWVLGGGQNSDFSGDGTTWERQHGHHLIADDLLLFFNNGPMNTASPVLEVELDLNGMTATFGFEYSSTDCGGNCLSQFMGDVQRLPSGNTFVTYSSIGIAHEVDPTGQRIRSFDLPAGSAGYSEHRPTLYGPPPR